MRTFAIALGADPSCSLPCSGSQGEPDPARRGPTVVSRLSAPFRSALVCMATVTGVSCGWLADELPVPAQSALEPAQPGAPPVLAPLQPAGSLALSGSEVSAIEELRHRGASITVFRGSGDVVVHFPLGDLERQWRRDCLPSWSCGVAVDRDFTPDDTGPPMTDMDLVYLDRISRLVRVNLGGTQVSEEAIASFRQAYPHVLVETGVVP